MHWKRWKSRWTSTEKRHSGNNSIVPNWFELHIICNINVCFADSLLTCVCFSVSTLADRGKRRIFWTIRLKSNEFASFCEKHKRDQNYFCQMSYEFIKWTHKGFKILNELFRITPLEKIRAKSLVWVIPKSSWNLLKL